MAEKRETTKTPQTPQIRSVPVDIYNLAMRGADAAQKWSDKRKSKTARSSKKRD